MRTEFTQHLVLGGRASILVLNEKIYENIGWLDCIIKNSCGQYLYTFIISVPDVINWTC